MAVRTNPGASAPEFQGWKSAPNIILPVEDDLQENKEKPSETGDFRSFHMHKTFMSLPNMGLAEKFRSRSTGDRMEIRNRNYATSTISGKTYRNLRETASSLV